MWSVLLQLPSEWGSVCADSLIEWTELVTYYRAPPPRISSEVLGGIVTKCLGARPKTKEGSILVCLMFVEIEQQETVLEEVMKGFTNKLPKIVAGAIQVIIRIVQ